MPGAADSSSSPRGWRAQTQAARRTTRGKWVNRALVSILGLAMVGILAWVLYRSMIRPDAHLFCLPVVDYDVGIVPPIPFAGEDIDALKEASYAGQPEVLDKLQRSDSIAKLKNYLMTVGEKEILMLYVSAHGVSHEGTAYLLCSDYLWNSGERTASGRRYLLSKLLRQVRECGAAVKLVVLDVGRLPADPRLGMLANEFPRLLQQEIQKTGDPRLWVFTANRSLERSHVSYAAKRSIFGYFLAEGLRGAADRDGDHLVDLAELYDFVRSGTADWVEQNTGGAESQTPWLLCGDPALTAPPADLELLPASDRGRRDEPQTESANKPDAKRQDPAAKDTEHVRKLLQRAWAARDQMQDRSGPDPWTPVDYAPHVWRELHGLLLGYERRYRCGKAFDPKQLARDLQQKILPLEEVVRQGQFVSDVPASTVLGRLVEARRKFLERVAKAGFRQGSEQESQLAEAIRLKNELVFQAPYYVRWHARACRASADTLPLHQPISDLLDELAVFVDELEALEAAGSGTANSLEIEDRLKEIPRGKQRLEALHRRIKQEGLEKTVIQLAANPKKPGNAGRIESLLSTPCLAAGQRMNLLEALQKTEGPSAEAHGADTDRRPEPPTIAKWQWDRLHEQTVLEAKLLSLADPAGELHDPAKVRARLAHLAGLADQYALRPGAADAEESQPAKDLWRGYRAFGKELGDFYARLPDEIVTRLGSNDLAEIAFCERMLRLLDSRDAGRFGQREKAVNSIAVRPIRLPVPPEERLRLVGPKGELQLAANDPTDFQLTIYRKDLSSDDARVILSYNQDEVEIETRDSRLPTVPNQWKNLSLQQPETVFTCTARAKAETYSISPLEVTVESDGHTAPWTVNFRLPAPDEVELQVHRVADQSGGTSRRWVEIEDDHVGLRPFPNRVTTYRFELVNKSRRERRVQVQLLAVPKLRSDEGLSREILVDGSGSLLPGIETLAASGEMTLPEGQQPQLVRFPSPKPPNPEQGPSASEAEKPPPPKPLTSHRIACAIRAPATGQWKWIKWIEFSPLAPINYVDPRVRYDARQGKITVDLLPRDPQDLPPLSEKKPISVQWTNKESLGAEPSGKFEAKLTAAEPVEDALFAAVVSRPGKVVPAHLTVDDYPRAFVFEVPCDQDSGPVKPAADLRYVKITHPEDGHPYRIPLPADSPMLVRFKVDAPADAFQLGQGEVQVGIDRNRDRELRPDEIQHRFWSDRQAHFYLQQATPQGDVKIKTEVGDFEVELDPAGLENMRCDVTARLVLGVRGPQRNREEKRDSVSVVLDGASPEFGRIEVPSRPVPHGKTLPVTVEAEDLSGVKEMKIGFDLNENDRFDGEEKPQVLNNPRSDGKWHADLPTEKLQPDTRYRILVVAVDKAGNPPAQNRDPIEVAVGPPPDENGGQKKSTVKGVLLLGSKRCPGVNVSLKGDTHNAAATSDQNGEVTFENVPPGSYTIEAGGRIPGFTVEGKTQLTVPKGGKPLSVNVKLEWK